jgi:hypothetical protein
MQGSGSGAAQIITDSDTDPGDPKNTDPTDPAPEHLLKILPMSRKFCLREFAGSAPVSVLDLDVFLEQRRLGGRVAALATGEAAVQVSCQLQIRKKL